MPVLGICYGEQAMAAQLGGEVEGGHHREFGRAEVEVAAESPLFEGVWRKGERYPVWMSHGDRVTRLPAGFEVIGTLGERALRGDRRRDAPLLRRAVPPRGGPHARTARRCRATSSAGSPAATGDWTMKAFRDEAIARIRAQVGKGRVICGLSGGVDSAVAAVLIHEAIADQLTCVFVDHGLLRAGEAEQRRDAVPRLATTSRSCTWRPRSSSCGALAGVTDPEVKRKTIGRLFIDMFEATEAQRRSAARSSWRRARSIPT